MRWSQLAVWATLLFLMDTNGWAATWIIVPSGDGADGSLRDVIATRAASGDTISLQLFAGQTLELSLGELVLNKNLTIIGGIGDPVTVKQTITARVFHVVNGATVTLQNLIISGGVESSGGGISVENSSTLTLNHSTVSGNMATSLSDIPLGGGIYVNGSNLNVQNSEIKDNSLNSGPNLPAYGGGICVETGSTLTIGNSTISANSVSSDFGSFGGGIDVGPGSTLTIGNSTVSANRASSSRAAYGGGIRFAGSTLTIRNSTISANSASASFAFGGGVFATVVSNPTVTLTNCTISNNSTTSTANSSAPGSAIFATGEGVILNNCTIIANRSIGRSGFALEVPQSSVVKNSLVIGNTLKGGSSDANGNFGLGSGYNQIGLTVDGVAHSLGDFVETETIEGVLVPKLADNGGPTRTIALAPRSPALDAGDPNFDSTTLPYDQRGEGYARVQRGRIDIGSFEQVNPLVLMCPADVTVVASSRDGAVLTPPLPTASDAVSGVTVLCDPATTQRLFPIGTTTFTCTAKDTAGNTSAPCTFHATVLALASDLPLSTGGCDCDSSGGSNGARSEYGLFLGLAVLLFVLRKRVRV